MEISGPPWVVQLLNEGKPFVDMMSGTLRPDDAGYPRAPGTTLTYTLDTLTGWKEAEYVVILLPASGTISVAASGVTINGAGTTLAYSRATHPSGVIGIVRVSGAHAYAVLSADGGGSSVTVVNSLTSTSTSSALSAAMGKSLKDTADALAVTVANKQDTLSSGTNIRTFMGASLLGSGNVTPFTAAQVAANAAAVAALTSGGVLLDASGLAIPLGRVVASVNNAGLDAQSLTGGVFTKISSALNTVQLNPAGEWSVANKRLTPARAGTYALQLSIQNGAAAAQLICGVYKNGSIDTLGATGVGAAFMTNGSVLFVQANGTTDYFEFYVYAFASTTVNNSAGSGPSTAFRAIYIGDGV